MNLRQLTMMLSVSALTLSIACSTEDDKDDDTGASDEEGGGGDEDEEEVPDEDEDEENDDYFEPDTMLLYTDGAVAYEEGTAFPSTWNFDGNPQPFLMRVLLVSEDWEGDVNDDSQCLVDLVLIDGTYVDASEYFYASDAWAGWEVDTNEYTEDGSGGGLLGWTEPCDELDPEFAPAVTDVVNSGRWAIGLGPAWGTDAASQFEDTLKGALEDADIPWEGDDENLSWENTVLSLYVSLFSDTPEGDAAPAPLNYGFAFEMDDAGDVVTDSDDYLVRLGEDDNKVSEWEEMPGIAYYRTQPFYGWSLSR